MPAADQTAFDQELLELTRRLLDTIVQGDWGAYAALCCPEISCFEGEALGHLVEGLEFHKYYFDLERSNRPVGTTICSPRVHRLGDDGAAVCYVRLTQRVDAQGVPTTHQAEETRVWRRDNGRWVHVHFHRSRNGG